MISCQFADTTRPFVPDPLPERLLVAVFGRGLDVAEVLVAPLLEEVVLEHGGGADERVEDLGGAAGFLLQVGVLARDRRVFALQVSDRLVQLRNSGLFAGNG